MILYRELHHEKDNVRDFNSQLSGEVVVSFEASGYSAWFAELLEGIGHQVWLGSDVMKQALSADVLRELL